MFAPLAEYDSRQTLLMIAEVFQNDVTIFTVSYLRVELNGIYLLLCILHGRTWAII